MGFSFTGAMFECINTHFSWSTLLGFEGRRPNTNDNILILPRPSSSIQSLYPSASISICTSTSTTPHKYNYTKVAASSNSNHGDGGDDDDDNLIQQDISAASPSRPNFFQFDDYGSNETISPDTNGLNFNKTGSSNSKSLHLDVDDDDNASLPIPRITRKKQTINRSSILAKQVITIHSAITLGFVSQLWLDTSSVSITHSITILLLFLLPTLCIPNFNFNFAVAGIGCRAQTKLTFCSSRTICTARHSSGTF